MHGQQNIKIFFHVSLIHFQGVNITLALHGIYVSHKYIIVTNISVVSY